MFRNLKRAVIRSLALVLAFAYAVEHVVIVNLLGESLARELLYVRAERRYAEPRSAGKPVADRPRRQALQETLLAGEVDVCAEN